MVTTSFSRTRSTALPATVYTKEAVGELSSSSESFVFGVFNNFKTELL